MSVPSFLDSAWDWEIAVDLKGKGWYPEVVLESRYCTTLVANEASGGPRTDGPMGIKERAAACLQLVAGLRLDGRPTRLLTLEVGTRGLTST